MHNLRRHNPLDLAHKHLYLGRVQARVLFQQIQFITDSGIGRFLGKADALAS